MMRYKYKVRELTPVKDDIVNVGETKKWKLCLLKN